MLRSIKCLRTLVGGNRMPCQVKAVPKYLAVHNSARFGARFCGSFMIIMATRELSCASIISGSKSTASMIHGISLDKTWLRLFVALWHIMTTTIFENTE